MPKASSAARNVKSRGTIVQLDQMRARKHALEGTRAYRGTSGKFIYSFAHEYAHWTADFDVYSLVTSFLEQGDERGRRIAALIESAEALLQPDEDDHACADDYPIASDETRSAAKDLAYRIAKAAFEMDVSRPLVPRFAAAGDVDLHWRTERAELLVTVPADPKKTVLFYGDTPGGASIKGSLHMDDNVDFLARWLVDHELSGRTHSGQRVRLQVGEAQEH
jgi:hypothetical protein